MIGQTISHYRILDKLGEGGMGVVYKAEDTKLDRIVALKFLPARLNPSEQDKARFVQEAKAAAALNHPNICSIIDIDEHEGPHGDRQLFIVMEFVDGQTLKHLVASTPGSILPLKRSIEIGAQIAEGLAAAHQKGIIHRDIKPENIMIRKDGIAQIMDFGLAKLRDSASRASRLTKEGSTVGTAGYMSPEQVQGQDVDHRSDIFSLGVLLYELFTGSLPFKGVHETALAYEIVNMDPPPMSSVQAGIDPSLDAIVLECLEKDPRERAQSAAQLAIDLKRYRRESSRQRASRITAARPVVSSSEMQGRPIFDESPEMPARRSRAALVAPWILLGLLVPVLLVLGYLYGSSRSHVQPVVRAFINQPQKLNFHFYGNAAGPAALSPDGKQLAFVATDSTGKKHLYVRALDELAAHELAGTDGAFQPFWSPDNRYIGFAANGKLRRIDAAGGAPVVICDAPFSRGGAWSKDGMIVFTPSSSMPLSIVPAKGGTPLPLTKFDAARKENSHRWPSFLPDGRHFLFLARTVAIGAQSEGDAICVGSVDGKEVKIVAHVSSNAQFASGYLLYTRLGKLLAQRMNESSFELTGDPVTVADSVSFDQSTDRSMFTVSENGILMYQTGSVQLGSRLVWNDRSGKVIGVATAADLMEYYLPRLSPDQKRVSTYIYDFQTHGADIWILDLTRALKTRFTFSPYYETNSVWTPDGSAIIYSSNAEGSANLYRKSSSGAGNAELLLRDPRDKWALDCSSDGKYLLYNATGDSGTQGDLWVLPLAGDKKPAPFLKTEFNEGDARFAPDAKWIAYSSDESGQNEIYIRSFPDHGSKWQVSSNGGESPRWRRDGKELYYISSDNKMMAADIGLKGQTVEVNHVRPLFEVPSIVVQRWFDYDVAADGQRFLLNIPFESQNSAPLTVVVNWQEETKGK